MNEADQITSMEKLEDMWVVAEAATLLHVKAGRIHAMIENGSLPSRFATREEVAQLIASGRIKGVPGSGIRLIPRYAVLHATRRRRPGWPKGVARKVPAN